jgi:hypothetical protein
VRPERFTLEKNSFTSSSLESATFRLVAQCLNHYATVCEQSVLKVPRHEYDLWPQPHAGVQDVVPPLLARCLTTHTDNFTLTAILNNLRWQCNVVPWRVGHVPRHGTISWTSKRLAQPWDSKQVWNLWTRPLNTRPFTLCRQFARLWHRQFFRVSRRKYMKRVSNSGSTTWDGITLHFE